MAALTPSLWYHACWVLHRGSIVYQSVKACCLYVALLYACGPVLHALRFPPTCAPADAGPYHAQLHWPASHEAVHHSSQPRALRPAHKGTLQLCWIEGPRILSRHHVRSEQGLPIHADPGHISMPGPPSAQHSPLPWGQAGLQLMYCGHCTHSGCKPCQQNQREVKHGAEPASFHIWHWLIYIHTEMLLHTAWLVCMRRWWQVALRW